MTGEADIPKDYNAEFRKITEHLDAQTGDPAVARLFSELRTFREQLATIARTQDVGIEHVDRLVCQVNEALEEARLNCIVGTLTGKIRPAYSTEGPNDDEMIEKYEQVAAIYDLGEVHYDERGPYWLLYDRQVYCGLFSRNGPLSNTRLELDIGIDPDSEPDDAIPWCIDSEDIYALAPAYPSAEQIEYQLARDYPEIFAVLQQLPDMDEDLPESERLQGLGEFLLEVDWSRYASHHTPDELKRLVYLIDDYITSRLCYDDGEYTFTVKGPIMSAVDTADGPRTVSRVVSEPMEIVGALGPIRLMEVGGGSDPNSATTRYRLKFITMCRIKGGGMQYVEIPVDSLVSEPISMSNDLLFTDALLHSEEGASGYEPIISPEVIVGGYAVEEVSAETFEQGDAAEEVNAPAQDPADYLAQLLEEGQAMREVFEAVLAQFDIFQGKYYADPDEALKDARAAQVLANEALGQYYNGEEIFELRGTELQFMPIDISTSDDIEERIFTVRTKIGTLQKGDEYGVTSRRGRLVTCECSVHNTSESGEDGPYIVVAELVFGDIDTNQTYSASDRKGDQYFGMGAMAYFRANMNEKTQFSICRYDELELLAETLEHLEEQYPEYEELVPRLIELQALIDASSHSTDLNSIDHGLIHELFDLAIDNPALHESIQRAIAHMLDDKKVYVATDRTAQHGTLDAPITVHGVVRGVLTPDDPALEQRTMLWIEQASGESVHVPIGALQGLVL